MIGRQLSVLSLNPVQTEWVPRFWLKMWRKIKKNGGKSNKIVVSWHLRHSLLEPWVCNSEKPSETLCWKSISVDFSCFCWHQAKHVFFFSPSFSTFILMHCNALADQYSLRTAGEQSSDAVFFLRASCISADPIMRRALLSIKQLQIKEIHGRGDKSIKITCGSQPPWVGIQFVCCEKTFV